MKKTISIAFILGISLCSNLSSQVAGGVWEYGPEFTGATAFDQLGTAIAIGPDFDGDGYPEMAVGLRGHRNAAGETVGAVWLMSGLTGQTIWTYEPLYYFEGAGVGYELSFVPDLTGDGVVDVVCGSYQAFSRMGKVTILSGADGSFVREHLGTPVSSSGDGINDILTSSPVVMAVGTAIPLGEVYYLDGASGQIIQTYTQPVLSDLRGFGSSLALVSDVDGDSFNDIAVGAAATQTNFGINVGHVTVISSQTGAAIWAVNGVEDQAGLGVRLINIGDINQDGFDDIASNHGGYGTPLTVPIFSGLDGSLLVNLESQASGPSAPAGFGTAVASFDRNGDGIPDLHVGEPSGTSVLGMYKYGALNTFIFKPFLYKESGDLSASTTSPLRLRLDFPISEAGSVFALLASATGNSTTTVNGFDIPLVIDSYFWRTIQTPPPSFRGVLDIDGNGLVDMVIPPVHLTSLVGTTMYFAAVSVRAGQPMLSSAAVPVEIVQ